MDVIIIGAGPAGLVAARRAAELGAKATLITRAEYGGMAANDGPVPVRTGGCRAFVFSHGRPFEIDAVAVVHEPIKDGFREGGLVDVGVPLIDGVSSSTSRGNR